MRVCLMIEGQEGVTWEQWLALARAAEEAGLDGLFRSDHYTAIVRPLAGSLDAWATLAALATQTTRLRLGTLVSPATFRHPSILARTALTVDHLSGGRVELGMGAGWYEREHVENGLPFFDAKTRFERLAEQVEIVARSWTEDGFDFDGRHYTLRDQRALPKPVQQPHPPIVLGGSAKPRAAALAARFAQEYNTTSASLEDCRERRASLDRACADAGRPPETLPLSLMTLAVLGERRNDVRERLARVLALRDDRRDVEEVLDAAHESWLVGTVDALVERLRELERAGVRRVMLQHLDHADLEPVSLMGELARRVASP